MKGCLRFKADNDCFAFPGVWDVYHQDFNADAKEKVRATNAAKKKGVPRLAHVCLRRIIVAVD